MRGHEINQLDSAGSTVTGIEVLENGNIRAYADKRKAGGVDGFWFLFIEIKISAPIVCERLFDLI